MSKILLVVDPQNDFISGSLAVPGAKAAMDTLVDYLESPVEDGEAPFDEFLVTMDSHPEDHCSFKENGGIWPKHCVFTPEKDIDEGWNGYKPLVRCFKESPNQLIIYLKGTDSNVEEYSIFESKVWGRFLIDKLKEYTDDEIWVAGIAGDYCVLETLKGLLQYVNPKNIVVMVDCIASIDKGEALNEFITTHKLKTIHCDE